MLHLVLRNRPEVASGVHRRARGWWSSRHLLKAFLDHYQAAELSSVVAVPVVVAGSPAHTFVGERYLRRC